MNLTLGNGLRVWDADIEANIKINHLKEVTNSVALVRNQPTPDGVLSYEIFGSSTQARRETMAYIDLHGHYMYPNAAAKLRSYSSLLSEILFGTTLYSFDQKTGTFARDDENGTSGPEFLYNCWPYIKNPPKESVTTKEVEQFFHKDRDKLFLTKILVMPPFFRDKNETTGAQMSLFDINPIYNSIISYTQNMANYTNLYQSMTYLTQGRVQQLLVDLYNKVIVDKVKGNPSKFGMLRRAMLSKNIDYSGLMVISSTVLHTNEMDEVITRFGYAVIPLARACAMFFPFIVHALKNYFDRLFIQGGKFPVNIVNPETHKREIQYRTVSESFDESYVTHLISRFINSPSTRFDPVEVPDHQGKIAFVGTYYKDELNFQRTMTVTDLLYIVAKDALSDKHVYVTRYPLDNYNGQFPARIELSTTIKTRPVRYGEKIYQYYPVIEGDPNNVFVESFTISNTFLDAMGGDSTKVRNHLVMVAA